MSVKSKLKLIIGIIITVITVYFSIKVLSRLNPREVFHSHINWSYLIISVIVYVYANYIRGLAYTRGYDGKIDRITAFQIVGIGHALNMVLPLHAGEGLRYVFFPTDYNAKRRTELMLIHAAADVVVIILFSLLAVPFAGFKDPNLLKALWLLTYICIAASVLLIAAVFLIPKLNAYKEKYINVSIAKMMLWVFLSWALLLLSTWIGLAAFGFGWKQSASLSLSVFAATNIINFIPASPGGIGLFEYGTILGMAGLGIEQHKALTAGLLLHLIQYMALLPMGAVLYVIAIHGKYGQAIKNALRCSVNKVNN